MAEQLSSIFHDEVTHEIDSSEHVDCWGRDPFGTDVYRPVTAGELRLPDRFGSHRRWLHRAQRCGCASCDGGCRQSLVSRVSPLRRRQFRRPDGGIGKPGRREQDISRRLFRRSLCFIPHFRLKRFCRRRLLLPPRSFDRVDHFPRPRARQIGQRGKNRLWRVEELVCGFAHSMDPILLRNGNDVPRCAQIPVPCRSNQRRRGLPLGQPSLIQHRAHSRHPTDGHRDRHCRDRRRGISTGKRVLHADAGWGPRLDGMERRATPHRASKAHRSCQGIAHVSELDHGQRDQQLWI